MLTFSRRGFTLLEMSIVLVIIGVILAGGAVTFSASVQQKQFDQTKEKMVVLQKALRDYWLTFGRLPCPANLSSYDATSTTGGNANFGKEAATPGTCSGGTPTANFTSAALPDGNFIVSGMIPTKTLQLPDDMAFDGWGRRIFYAVDSDYTADNAGNNLSDTSTDVTAAKTRITVKAANGSAKTTQAVYVILSHGANGHGAYTRSSSTTRLSSGSNNAMEKENCDCDSSASGTGFNSVFYQAPYSTNTSSIIDTFDDLLVYATRGNLYSAKE